LRYARGIYEIDIEESEVERIAYRLRREGFTIKRMLKEIAISEGFHGPYRGDDSSDVPETEARDEMRDEMRDEGASDER
jgi:hypothetical protein